MWAFYGSIWKLSGRSHVGATIIKLFLTTGYSQEERPRSTEYEIVDGKDFQS